MKKILTILPLLFILNIGQTKSQNKILTEDIQYISCAANAEVMKVGPFTFKTSYGYYRDACVAQTDSFIVIKYRWDKRIYNQAENNDRLGFPGYAANNSSPQQRTMGRWIFCQDGNITRFDSLKNAMKNSNFYLTSNYKYNTKKDSVTVTTTVTAMKDYYGGLTYISLITDGGRDIQKADGSWILGIDKDIFRKTVNTTKGTPLPPMIAGTKKVMVNKCSVDQLQNGYKWSPTINVISMIQDFSYTASWFYYRIISAATDAKQI